MLAKKQLFRTLDDVNPVPELAKLEAEIMEEANRIGVGAMGFGGKVSLIGCKIVRGESSARELFRFGGLRLLGVPAAGRAAGRIQRRDHALAVSRSRSRGRAHGAGGGIPADRPRSGADARRLSEEQVRALRVGDVVLISGEVFTGRDAVHAHLMKNAPPVDMRGAVLYHCGPVMLKQGDGWTVKAAGPTTSSREEPYQATIIEKYGVRAVIGKGGMGAKTLAALEKSGAVYLNAIGGAAQFYARTVEKVLGVHLHRVRNSRSDVASAREQFRRHRHHGRARQQPARRRGARDRREAAELQQA